MYLYTKTKLDSLQFPKLNICVIINNSNNNNLPLKKINKSRCSNSTRCMYSNRLHQRSSTRPARSSLKSTGAAFLFPTCVMFGRDERWQLPQKKYRYVQSKSPQVNKTSQMYWYLSARIALNGFDIQIRCLERFCWFRHTSTSVALTKDIPASAGPCHIKHLLFFFLYRNSGLGAMPNRTSWRTYDRCIRLIAAVLWIISVCSESCHWLRGNDCAHTFHPTPRRNNNYLEQVICCVAHVDFEKWRGKQGEEIGHVFHTIVTSELVFLYIYRFFLKKIYIYGVETWFLIQWRISTG